MTVPGPDYPYEEIPDDLPILDLSKFNLKSRKDLAAARRLHVLDQLVIDAQKEKNETE
jgi:hypothetical protein